MHLYKINQAENTPLSNLVLFVNLAQVVDDGSDT